MPRKPRTVLQACVATLGVHRGAIAAAHVAQWAIATAELGHVPTTVEYSEWWAVDERTGWRHRADCRTVFGDEWQNVVETIARVIAEKKARSPRAVMGLALTA